MGKMIYVHLKMQRQLLDELDEHARRRFEGNRSLAIRSAIRQAIDVGKGHKHRDQSDDEL